MSTVLQALALHAKDAKQGIMSKFRKTTPPPTIPSPLGLRIGGVVEVDTLDFRLNDELRMAVPDSTLILVAYGSIKMGGSVAHRFYAKSGAMLEVTTEGGDQNVQSVRLFTMHDEIMPPTPDEWEFWIGRGTGLIGFPMFDTIDKDGKEGARYVRFGVTLNADIEAEPERYRAEPWSLAETVVTDPAAGSAFLIEHQAMLYGREYAEGKFEHLLVSCEDTGDGAKVELMLGIDVDTSMITVV